MRTLALSAVAFLLFCTEAKSIDRDRRKPESNQQSISFHVLPGRHDRGSGSSAYYVWLVLENRPLHCRPIYVDPVFTPVGTPTRNIAQIEIKLIDANSHTYDSRRQPALDMVLPRPHELRRLDCGTMLGQAVDLTSPFWFGKLKPGRYRVRATLSIAMRTFALHNPAYIGELARLGNVTASAIDRQIVNLNLVADELEISIP
jgi:hypothetical protein